MTSEEPTAPRAPRHRATAAVNNGDPDATPAEAVRAPVATDSTAKGDPASADLAGDPQQLKEEIERTREQVGQTVEALAAKTDVKAQAMDKARQITERVKGGAGQAVQQAAAKADTARSQLASTTAGPRQKIQAISKPGKDQIQSQASAAAAAISAATPEPVRGAVRKTAATARERRLPLALAAGLAALAGLITRWRRRR
jgi:hypothetical protein